MTYTPTQKEKMLLQDQQKHEEICVQKYTSYAQQAQCSQLKQLFNSLAGKEQEHLNSINQLLSGQVPSMGQQSQSGQGSQMSMGQNGQGSQMMMSASQVGQMASSAQGSQMMSDSTSGQSMAAGDSDQTLCNDMLMTEKYVSGAYDTAIFEFTNSNVRQVLNHIQKEEQQHGEAVFNYMQSKGWYKPQ